MKPVSLIALFCALAFIIVPRARADWSSLSPDKMALAKSLANTYWSWQGSLKVINDQNGWIRLNPDGTLTAGWNNKKHHWWPIDGSTIEYDAQSTRHVEHRLHFNDDLTEATDTVDAGSLNSMDASQYAQTSERLAGPNRTMTLGNQDDGGGNVSEVNHGGKAASFGPAAASTSAMPPLQTLSQEAPNVSDWVLAPLNVSVPSDIRTNMELLRENLLDEGKMKPVASQETYAAASQLCSALISALDDRDNTLIQYGYRKAQSNANIGVDDPSMNVDRNYKMSWPQFVRERVQAAEVFQADDNSARVQKQLPLLEWAQRTTQMRKYLDFLYEKYRDDLRNSIKPG